MSIYLSKKNHKKRQIICDINITPFVDILLVLLIIFMVAAPMMTSGVTLDLPKGTENSVKEEVKTISISLKSDGSIFLQDEPTKLSNLVASLLEVSGSNFKNKIFVRADKSLDYGRVMDVVRIISAGGFSQVVLVTELVQ